MNVFIANFIGILDPHLYGQPLRADYLLLEQLKF